MTEPYSTSVLGFYPIYICIFQFWTLWKPICSLGRKMMSLLWVLGCFLFLNGHLLKMLMYSFHKNMDSHNVFLHVSFKVRYLWEYWFATIYKSYSTADVWVCILKCEFSKTADVKPLKEWRISPFCFCIQIFKNEHWKCISTPIFFPCFHICLFLKQSSPVINICE